MIIVTGGAGFIGSAFVRKCNDEGINDIIIVDNINKTDKWLNIRNKKYVKYVNKNCLFNEINDYKDVTAIIHMGAQSSTIEKDFDYLYNNNFLYTKQLWEYASKNNIVFIYASSAATYGAGENGFDDKVDIENYRPLNKYGYSKHLFDLWVKNQAKVFPKRYYGLKFFNVFGPNEYFKGNMASMVFHGYNQIKETGKIRLFKSYRDDCKDGEQKRDFVYVKDIINVMFWLLNNDVDSGLYNLGTGKAESFNLLANSIFEALDLKPNIEYIDMPSELISKYQYYTCAEMNKLSNKGYNINSFYDLKSAVFDYVRNYLSKDYISM